MVDDEVVDVASVAAAPTGLGSKPTEYAIGLRTARDAIATIALSYGSRIEVADVMVLTDGEAWHVSGAELRSSGEVLARGTIADAQTAALRAQDAAFLDACRGGPAFPVSAASVIPTLRIQQRVADPLDR